MEILEARVEYLHGKIDRVTVLADFTPEFLKDEEPMCDVRAVFASRKHMHGYLFFNGAVNLNAELLKNVVEFGIQTVDRDEIFPNWKEKHTLKKQLHSDFTEAIVGVAKLIDHAIKEENTKNYLPSNLLPEFDLPVKALVQYHAKAPVEEIIRRIKNESSRGWQWSNEKINSFITGEVLQWSYIEKEKSNH